MTTTVLCPTKRRDGNRFTCSAETDYYHWQFIKGWRRPNPGCICCFRGHSTPPMSVDDETDFRWLMKIPNHVRSATTSHADARSYDCLVLTSSSARGWSAAAAASTDFCDVIPPCRTIPCVRHITYSSYL